MKKLLLCLLPLVLGGCQKAHESLTSICADDPGLCADLNNDGWCRYERARLIRQRDTLATAQSKHAYHLYRTLEATERYRDCIGVAARVVHEKQKARQSDRGTAYLNSLVAVKALEAQIGASKEPHLLYYRYSRQGDMQALKEFLTYEGTGKLNTLELKAMLATYYAKRDKAKTYKLLVEALSLPREEPNNKHLDLFQTLPTLAFQQGHYQEAYVWSRVAQMQGVKDMDLQSLKSILLKDKKLLRKLDNKADAINEAIEDGHFKPAMATIDQAQSSALPN